MYTRDLCCQPNVPNWSAKWCCLLQYIDVSSKTQGLEPCSVSRCRATPSSITKTCGVYPGVVCMSRCRCMGVSHFCVHIISGCLCMGVSHFCVGFITRHRAGTNLRSTKRSPQLSVICAPCYNVMLDMSRIQRCG